MTDNDIGEQFPQPDLRGWLTFKHLPNDLQNQEDATQQHDFEVGAQRHWRPHVRDATATERTLLAHLGYALPTRLRTRVSWPHIHIRNRSWPQLDGSAESSPPCGPTVSIPLSIRLGGYDPANEI